MPSKLENPFFLVPAKSKAHFAFRRLPVNPDEPNKAESPLYIGKLVVTAEGIQMVRGSLHRAVVYDDPASNTVGLWPSPADEGRIDLKQPEGRGREPTVLSANMNLISPDDERAKSLGFEAPDLLVRVTKLKKDRPREIEVEGDLNNDSEAACVISLGGWVIPAILDPKTTPRGILLDKTLHAPATFHLTEQANGVVIRGVTDLVALIRGEVIGQISRDPKKPLIMQVSGSGAIPQTLKITETAEGEKVTVKNCGGNICEIRHTGGRTNGWLMAEGI